MRATRLVIVSSCVIIGMSCGSDAARPPTVSPSPTPTPAVPPAGAFAVIETVPPLGSTVSSAGSDLEGLSTLNVTLSTSSTRSIASAYFVLELLDGSTECLRTAIAYCRRTDGGTWGEYRAGEAANYKCTWFVRDNQQPSCGRAFVTTRLRWILVDNSTRETVVTAESPGGWSFAFGR